MPPLPLRHVVLALALLRVLAHAPTAVAQAAPAATGPGSFLSFGAGASSFQEEKSQGYAAGEVAYIDANVLPRIGLEAEFRRLGLVVPRDTKLAGVRLTGPRIRSARNVFRPYLKLLTGTAGLVPGAGLDVHLAESRLTVRLADVEYQVSPRRSQAFCLTTGLALDLFAPRNRPGGRHF